MSEPCPVCGGFKFIDGANNQPQRCWRCRGFGTMERMTMVKGDRVEILIGRDKALTAQFGTIVRVHMINGEERYDVRCDKGSEIHWCRKLSLRPVSETEQSNG